MRLSSLIHRCEFVEPKRYDGRNELQVAVIGCLLWFVAIVIRLGFSSKPWTLIEKLTEASSFVVFAAIPVFFLATPQGEGFIRKVLLKNHGFWFQTGMCGLLAIYLAWGKLLDLSSDRFRWLSHLNSLIFENSFWLNTCLFLAGVFVVLRIPFRLLSLRRRSVDLTSLKGLIAFMQRQTELILLLVINFIYISLSNTSLVSPRFEAESSGYYIGISYFLISLLMGLPVVKQTSAKGLMVFDGLLSAVCISSLFWFSGISLSFGVFIGLTLFILVVIYGTGLGREHFGYSFQVRSQDVRYVLSAIGLAALILIPSAFLLKFAQPPAASLSGNQLLPQALFLFSYAILFSFRVGIFEEILFRAGLMVLIRDQLQARNPDSYNPQRLMLLSAILCSVIFGLCHLGNTPRAGSALSPAEYKVIYLVLATVASMFYSLAFGATNRLWASITIHGVVDTTAVVLLGASLTVPF